MAKKDNKRSYGYGKRPLWQWIVLYLGVGVILYGVIYYFLLAKNAGYNSNYVNPEQQTSEESVLYY